MSSTIHTIYGATSKVLSEARYWNCQDTNICIVAVITKDIDWAAYIGAESINDSEYDTIKWAADYGCKLSEKDARYFFPDFTLPYRN